MIVAIIIGPITTIIAAPNQSWAFLVIPIYCFEARFLKKEGQKKIASEEKPDKTESAKMSERERHQGCHGSSRLND